MSVALAELVGAGFVDAGGNGDLHEVGVGFLHKKVEGRVLGQRKQGDLGGSDPLLEFEVRALLVFVPDVEAVLEETVQNAANAERRLDDGGSELGLLHGLILLLSRDHGIRDLVAVHVGLAVRLESGGDGLESLPVIGERLESAGHVPLLVLEHGAELSPVQLELRDLDRHVLLGLGGGDKDSLGKLRKRSSRRVRRTRSSGTKT